MVLSRRFVLRRPVILEVSYEIIAEICLYLTPQDLLSLYRTNTEFRKKLGSLSGRLDWKRARRNIDGLPSCPRWLSEPQYAALCFDDHCQKCLQPKLNGKGLIWHLNARYCDACLPTQVTSSHPLEGFPGGSYLDDYTRNPTACVPYTRVGHVHEDLYHVPHIAQLKRQIEGVEVHHSGSTDDDNSAQDARRLAVMQTWETWVVELFQHSRQCFIWKEAYERGLREAAQAVKAQRRHQILRRLGRLGYGADIEYLGHGLSALPLPLRSLLERAVPLTDREWAKISERFTTFLTSRQALLHQYRHRNAMLSRLDSLTGALAEFGRQSRCDALPHPTDITSDPVVNALITLPREADLPNSVFLQLVPKWIDAWTQEREATLLSLLAQDKPSAFSLERGVTRPHRARAGGSGPPAITRASAPSPSAMLSLLATFYCKNCRTVISAIAAMTHWCCYRRVEDWRRMDTSPIVTGVFPPLDRSLFESACLLQFRGTLEWSASCLIACATVTDDVLTAVGCRTRSCSYISEQLGHAHVECGACRTSKAVLVMTCVRAIEHALTEHQGTTVHWSLASRAVAAKAKSIEYARRKLTAQELAQRTASTCLKCPHPFSMQARSKEDSVLHLDVAHGIKNPRCGDHYLEAQEWFAYAPPSVLIVSPDLRSADLDKIITGGEIFRTEGRVGFLALH